ncbi:diguanylate cyclase [Solidesulfovibrio fructosivorans JJ]]|uniref:diguanylate cyclase n=1 Tax=Solidesulfovibrio fructosivorans JJ] TaxID=596151 RepID=E1JV76_SOLFR|nr:diguanylate cyclase [Solidesulfovibrio fructosivorans JJ]]
MRLRKMLGLDGLRGQLRFYTLLLVVLPILLALLCFSLFQRGHVVERERQSLVYSLRQECNVVRTWIDERVDDAEYFARIAAIMHSDSIDLSEYYKLYVKTHEYVKHIFYVGTDGVILASNIDTKGASLGDRAYFKDGREGRSALELIPVGRLTGNPACVFSVPITAKDGGFGGVLAISVHLKSLDRWLRENVAYSGSPVILCDTEGRILAPTTVMAAAGGPGKARVSPELLACGEKGGVYVGPDGREMLGAAVSLGRDGWRLVSDMPVSEVLAGYRRQMRWVVFGALATVALVLPLVLRLSRKIERPLTTLAAYARELRETRYAAACPIIRAERLPREVAELRDAFCSMAGEVRGRIEEAERLSVQDALTGLYNRRFLFSGGMKLLAASQRSGRPCSCLMLDVDHFKTVNDTHGHTAGDQVLVHLGRVLSGCVRKSDLVARYGGEEFAVLLTGADVAQAAMLAERFRHALSGAPCMVENRALVVTVSIGVAALRDQVEYGETPLDDLLARADKALYVAKAAGRNCVKVDKG